MLTHRFSVPSVMLEKTRQQALAAGWSHCIRGHEAETDNGEISSLPCFYLAWDLKHRALLPTFHLS